METFWSTSVQGTKALDLDRERRLRDDRKDLLLQLLRLQPGMKIADIGCGPGTLTRKLACWLGAETEILGIDRDIIFLAHAKERARELRLTNIQYITGDALALPLKDNSLDATTSFTVIEHVPGRRFLQEQMRVVRPGGVVSVMAVPPNRYIKGESELVQESPREKELWAPIVEVWDELDKQNNIGKFQPEPRELVLLFAELGLTNIQVDALALPVVLDDARNSREQQLVILEADRQNNLEALEIGLRKLTQPLPTSHVSELRDLILARHARRRHLLEQGEASWDFLISTVLIVSGEKTKRRTTHGD